jgi:hypothetical protein
VTKKTLIVTWTDGKQETYPFTHQETREGTMRIWTEYSGAMIYRRYDERIFPLDGIRVFKIEED